MDNSIFSSSVFYSSGQCKIPILLVPLGEVTYQVVVHLEVEKVQEKETMVG